MVVEKGPREARKVCCVSSCSCRCGAPEVCTTAAPGQSTGGSVFPAWDVACCVDQVGEFPQTTSPELTPRIGIAYS
ncbi:unnamed protein product [Calypogeia fissa]